VNPSRARQFRRDTAGQFPRPSKPLFAHVLVSGHSSCRPGAVPIASEDGLCVWRLCIRSPCFSSVPNRITSILTGSTLSRWAMKKVRPNRGAPRTFVDVASLIVPHSAPKWLTPQLEWWAQGLRHDRLADQHRPTAAETRNRLLAFEQAVFLIQCELNSPAIRNILETVISVRRLSASQFDLRDLSERANLARSSSLLVGASEGAKRGRGKPKVPDLFGAKTLCAARVVELWRHFHGIEPGKRNLKAAGVAEAYWRASGGRSGGYGNPLTGWFSHFKTVRNNQHSATLMGQRLIWRRDLEQSARRGRPPWYLGQYFPYKAT
jgi:hypothetical protein